MEVLLIITVTAAVVSAVAGVFAALFNFGQFLLQWYTLQEIGDLDKDRKDWFEKTPWRHYDNGKS